MVYNVELLHILFSSALLTIYHNITDTKGTRCDVKYQIAKNIQN